MDSDTFSLHPTLQLFFYWIDKEFLISRINKINQRLRIDLLDWRNRLDVESLQQEEVTLDCRLICALTSIRNPNSDDTAVVHIEWACTESHGKQPVGLSRFDADATRQDSQRAHMAEMQELSLREQN